MNNNFEKRVKTAVAEIGEIYKKYKIQASLSIRIPNNQKTPFLVNVALWILGKYGAIIDTLYKDLRK